MFYTTTGSWSFQNIGVHEATVLTLFASWLAKQNKPTQRQSDSEAIFHSVILFGDTAPRHHIACIISCSHPNFRTNLAGQRCLPKLGDEARQKGTQYETFCPQQAPTSDAGAVYIARIYTGQAAMHCMAYIWHMVDAQQCCTSCTATSNSMCIQHPQHPAPCEILQQLKQISNQRNSLRQQSAEQVTLTSR